MPDRYTYPDSEVLVNIPGYRDAAAWHRAETAAVQVRMAELREFPLPGDLDLAHLRGIHRHLTQDLYTWGGELRDTDTGPAGTGLAHCRPECIPAEAERIFGRLAAMGRLAGLDREGFSRGLAWVWGETTALHPFRDVNTRSQHIFFVQLAGEAGWAIDWTRIDPHVFAHARTVAIARDESGIEALLHPALIPLEEAQHRDELLDRLARSQEAFFAPRPTRPVAELDRDLERALRRRADQLAPPPDLYDFGASTREPPRSSGPDVSL